MEPSTDKVCKHCWAELNTEYYKLHSANNPDWLYCSGKCLDEWDKKIKAGDVQTTFFQPGDINEYAVWKFLLLIVLFIALIGFGLTPRLIVAAIWGVLCSILSTVSCGVLG